MAKKKSNFKKGFRKNKRIKHPTYLIDENGRMYQYIGITHSSKTGDSKNIPLKQNPNPKDNRRAYIRPVVDEDKPENFSRRMKDWRFSVEDRETVKQIIDDYKKKKPRK